MAEQKMDWAEGWLTFSRYSRYRYAGESTMRARWTADRPILNRDEVTMKVRVQVTASVFNPQPIQAVITVPESSVVVPDITVEEPDGDGEATS